MLCLLALPIDIISFSVFGFLDLYSLVKVDFSLSNQHIRQSLQSLVKVHVIEFSQGNGLNACLLQWLKHSSIYLPKLIIQSGVELKDFVKTIPIFRDCEILCMCDCEQLCNSFEVLFKGTHFLRNVSLSRCSSVSNSVIESLAVANPNLETISLIECTELTDQAIATLSQNCMSLKDINLQGCTGLSSVSLQHLMSLRTVLRTVNLRGCRGIMGGVFNLIEACTGPTSIYIGKS